MDKLTPEQQTMLATWQQHTYAEFVLKDADAALATMTEHPYVFIVPSGIGRVVPIGADRDSTHAVVGSICSSRRRNPGHQLP
jgi:hypothetical protein